MKPPSEGRLPPSKHSIVAMSKWSLTAGLGLVVGLVLAPAAIGSGCSTAQPAGEDDSVETERSGAASETPGDSAGWSARYDELEPVLARASRQSEGLLVAAEIAEPLEILEEAAAATDGVDGITDPEGVMFDAGELVETFGLDPTEPSAWRDIGVDPTGPVAAVHGGEAGVWCLPVDSPADFAAFLRGPFADYLHLDDRDERTDETGRRDIQILGEDLAWSHLDGHTCATGAEGEAGEVLAGFVEPPEAGASIVDTPGFERFRNSRLGERPGAVYSTVLSFGSPMAWEFFGLPSPEEAVGYGAAVGVEDDTLQIDYWMGTDEGAPQDGEPASVDETDLEWSRLATDELRFGLRLAMDRGAWNRQWDRHVQLYPAFDRFRTGLEGHFGGRLDLEDDLVEHLAGRVGVFVYANEAVERPFEAILERSAPPPIEEVAALAVAELDSPEAAESLVETVVPVVEDVAGREAAEVRAVEEAAGDLEVLDTGPLGVRLYRAGRAVIVASAGTAPERVDGLVDAESTDDETGWAGPVGADDFTGVYLRGDGWRVVDEALNLGDIPGEDNFDEGLVTADRDETGAYLQVVAEPVDPFLVEFARDELESQILGWKAQHNFDRFRRAQRRAVEHFEDQPEGAGEFPGGERVRVRTTERIPQAGETVEPDPVVAGGDENEVDPEAVLESLGIPVDQPLYFRITYETGSGPERSPLDYSPFERGVPDEHTDSAVLIRAEADFDPTTDDHHTTSAYVEIDDQGQPVGHPLFTEFEFH